MTEDLTPDPGAQPAEPTDIGQTPEPAEPTGGEAPAEPGATPKEPESVPYSRFKEVYGKAKQAERDADYWRNEAQRNKTQPIQTPTQTPVTGKPTPEQFNDYNDYVEALTDWKVQQKDAQNKSERDQQAANQRESKFFSKMSEGAAKFEDFEQVVFDPYLQISPAMKEALHDCDHAPEIAYHLGKNPQEAGRIAALSPVAAAREIGKLEAKFSGPNPPAQKSKTNAPAPTSPVGGNETPSKKLEDMSTEDFIESRNRQERGG